MDQTSQSLVKGQRKMLNEGHAEEGRNLPGQTADDYNTMSKGRVEEVSITRSRPREGRKSEQNISKVSDEGK